jgi:hypothetical protein
MIFLQVNQPFHFFGGIWRPTATRHHIPSYYKYRSFDDDFSLNLILPGEIFLQNPVSFEDHEDCQIVLPYSKLSIEQLRTIGVKHRSDPESDGMPDDDFEKYLIHRHASIVSAGERGDREAVLAQAKRIGVFSMTPRWDNPYLWNKYGAGGTGFCVEFDSTKLFQYVSELGIGLYADEVTYSDSALEIDLTKEDNGAWSKLLSTKKIKWKDEEEDRLITYGIKDENRAVQLEDGIIRSIIVGENISQKNMNLIRSVLQRRYDKGFVFELPIYKVYTDDKGVLQRKK